MVEQASDVIALSPTSCERRLVERSLPRALVRTFISWCQNVLLILLDGCTCRGLRNHACLWAHAPCEAQHCQFFWARRASCLGTKSCCHLHPGLNRIPTCVPHICSSRTAELQSLVDLEWCSCKWCLGWAAVVMQSTLCWWHDTTVPPENRFWAPARHSFCRPSVTLRAATSCTRALSQQFGKSHMAPFICRMQSPRPPTLERYTMALKSTLPATACGRLLQQLQPRRPRQKAVEIQDREARSLERSKWAPAKLRGRRHCSRIMISHRLHV